MNELASATATHSIVIERMMPHPPEKIWRALTQGPLIEEWLMKNDFKPVVGHKFNLRSYPMPGWNGVTDCKVLIVELNKRLSYSWNASGDKAANGLKTIVTWTLTLARGARSRVRNAPLIAASSSAVDSPSTSMDARSGSEIVPASLTV